MDCYDKIYVVSKTIYCFSHLWMIFTFGFDGLCVIISKSIRSCSLTHIIYEQNNCAHHFLILFFSLIIFASKADFDYSMSTSQGTSPHEEMKLYRKAFSRLEVDQSFLLFLNAWQIRTKYQFKILLVDPVKNLINFLHISKWAMLQNNRVSSKGE